MAELFDTRLKNTCSILGRVTGTVDAAGLTPRTTVVLEANVPCQVSAVITDNEITGVKEISINTRHVIMRPWAISGSTPSSPRSQAEAAGKTLLNTDMFILANEITYNITEVINWSGPMFHHFTVVVKQVA